ncbi:PIN domain-containing protein [Sphingobium subterraneum]|uniref:PIN domain nuclease of toxin-antitoxin system n=1 Tax=Sphingobium subterraneum TaxID=627688 RepID=A0A841IVF3_9SPHN|nr:PIN domain nuclease of toxin-antitoxin system [Sphingobium subterraneum]
MSAFILDASALLAMLREEPGGDAVAEAVGEARMSVVNLAEVVSHFIHNGMPMDAVDAMLRPLPIALVPADADLSRIAGHLRALTAEAGLSLGDRFCLALALRDKLPAWTSDRQWSSIAQKTGVEVVTIR